MRTRAGAMEPVEIALAVYLTMTVIFLIPTYIEGALKNETSLKLGILSILCCAIWPLLLIYVAMLRYQADRG